MRRSGPAEAPNVFKRFRPFQKRTIRKLELLPARMRPFVPCQPTAVADTGQLGWGAVGKSLDVVLGIERHRCCKSIHHRLLTILYMTTAATWKINRTRGDWCTIRVISNVMRLNPLCFPPGRFGRFGAF